MGRRGYPAASRDFRVAFPARLIYREWDDECVVYDSHTGDTHLLTASAAMLLRTLGPVPQSPGEVRERLAAAVSPAPSGEELETWLGQLEQLGLVERGSTGDRP